MAYYLSGERQGNTLFTHTELEETAHMLVAGLNAEQRSLEVEQQVAGYRVQTGCPAIFVIILFEVGVGDTGCKLGIQSPVILAQPIEFYRRQDGEVAPEGVCALLTADETVLVVGGKYSNATHTNQRAGVIIVFHWDGAEIFVAVLFLSEHRLDDISENINPNWVGHGTVTDADLMTGFQFLRLSLSRDKNEWNAN